ARPPPRSPATTRRRRAAASRRSADRATSRRLHLVIHLLREVGPQPLVERAEGGVGARTDRITGPRNRYRIMLGDARPRAPRQQVDVVGQTDRLFEIVRN